MDGWVGRPISEITSVWGPPTKTSSRGNNGKQYTYHLNKLDPSCWHHWQVDAQGIITGYSYEGSCRPVG